MTLTHRSASPAAATTPPAPALVRELVGGAARAAPRGPFDLEDDDAYCRWRDAKLRTRPSSLSALTVEIDDPRRLRPAEHAALLAVLARANMVLYATRAGHMDRGGLRALGAQLGLQRLDRNFLADDDGVSSIRVCAAGERRDFIPYTDQPLSWHTDGYYNPPQKAVRALLLHCVEAAVRGGENALLDHEQAYIALRERDPGSIAALSASGAMTIPARTDARGVARAAQSGPVFSLEPRSGSLHMRYSARARNIAWRSDAATEAARAHLNEMLAPDSPLPYRVRLEAGMGLLCANVLHNRAGFEDDPRRPRLLLRARYFDALERASAPPRAG